MDMDFRRIQFTPDMLPSDILGVEIYNQKTGDFEVKSGPIFANIILADEINRTTPKVQSALLEAMQERQVTLG
jgi:MoxR-like ATPase